MKKLIALAVLVAAAASLNVGCSASASVRPTDARQLNTTTQVAYVSAPTK